MDRNLLGRCRDSGFERVALRKESVDRNLCIEKRDRADYVALRKESVDRNVPFSVIRPAIDVVALRKESVDRNSIVSASIRVSISRSPQGERG